MKTYDEEFRDAYERSKERSGGYVHIYTYTAGYDEIIDRAFLRKKYKVHAIAIKWIEPISRFELMEL